ncbi:MAG: FHA domain-containing protein [Planctomycetota bacterium]
MWLPSLPGISEVTLVAQGSMGHIFRVRDERGELRALKALPPEMAGNKWIVRCLRHEFELARKFEHRNLVRAHRFLESKDDIGFLMDYVDGTEFKTLLHEKKLDFSSRFLVVRGVVDALHYLHTLDSSCWILHCDIKPENVLVRHRDSGLLERSDAVLVDYGTAMLVPTKPRLFDPGRIREMLSRQRIVGGSYLYMSPEQTEAGNLDPRSDIYSMGCLMFEVFCGRPPFRSKVAAHRVSSAAIDEVTLDREELAVMHREEPAPDPRTHNPELQAPLADIILRCLQKDPSRRYQTVFALASELAKIRIYRDDVTVEDDRPVTHLRKGVLIAVKGLCKGLRLSVDSVNVTIGRHVDNPQDLSIPDEDKKVSGRHCQVFRHGDSFVIEDLESRNGTFVNGTKVKRQSLQEGDKIQVGEHQFRFELTS